MASTYKSIDKRTLFLIYFFVLIYCLIYYVSLFVFKIIDPNYFLCVEVVNQQLKFGSSSFDFLYPLSCDQKNYFIGFENFNNIITTDYYPYQTRSLYILLVFSIGKILQFINEIFSLNINLILNISTLITQIFIVSISIYLIDKLLKKYFNYNKFSLFLITGFVTVSPLIKWGIFTPSHQLLTLLVLITGIYTIENYKKYEIYKFSILMGVLYLGHRSFLLAYILFLGARFVFLKKLNIFDYIKSSIIFATPSFIFYLYIRILGYHPYDAATEYWGQFIWIFSFWTGKKSEGQWYCQTIPENFICYFQDTKSTLIYLLVPIIFISIKEFTDVYFLKKNKLKIINFAILFAFLMYGFYSFIGWYPPLRFNLYSIGNCLTLIGCLQIVRDENLRYRLLYFSSLFLYFLNLNHWNNPDVINFNNSLFIVLLLMFIYFLIKHKEYKKLKLNN